MKTSKLFMLGVLLVVGIVWTATAQAVPSFARKYDKPCSTCHTAWPLLNTAGRKFKEAGYRFPTDAKVAQEVSEDLYWGKNFPISVILKARPYDKEDSAKDPKLRALHEVELIVAGVIGKKWSGFFEYEGEDEKNFEFEFAHAVLGYHHSPALNVQLAMAPAHWADPYDTFYMRRLTRNRPGTIDSSFGGADNGGGGGAKLRDNRQVLSIYGRPVDNVFYSVGISGLGKDEPPGDDKFQGENPNTLHARVAVDVTPDIMVGGFWLDGTCETGLAASCPANRDFTRSGLDVQADVGDFRFTAAFISADDDNATATAEESNDAFYVQGLYVVKGKQGQPLWVPLIRFDNTESNNGADETKAVTLNLQRYFTQNVKGYIEYYDETDKTGGGEDSRLTLQLEVGF